MKQDVATAVDELRRGFPATTVWSEQDSEGGAYVIVEKVDIGTRYAPSSTWLGGHITALYPYADIYPLFMDASVRRADGVEFVPPLTLGHGFAGRPAIQISRANNHTQNFPQTTLAKFLKVIHFLEHLQ